MRDDVAGARDASHERAANVMSEDLPGNDDSELERLRSEVAAQRRDIHDLDELEHRQETLIRAPAPRSRDTRGGSRRAA
jgi:hypothetical protein